MKSDRELAALCQREISAARRYHQTNIAGDRRRVIDYYNGKMDDLEAAKGRSSAVSTDIADVIGHALPGLMRIFEGSDHIVEYDPRGPEDAEYSEQVTDYINFLFEESDGYHVLYSAFHDSLLMRNGFIKHWWQEETEEKLETYTGLTDDQYTELVAPDDVVKVVEHDLRTEAIEGGQITFHDCTLKRRLTKGKICLEAIPPEDVFYNAEATGIEDVRFIGHRLTPTRSSLIKDGHSRDKVNRLPTYSQPMQDDEGVETARRQGSDLERIGAADKAMETVELFECYIQADRTGDGVATWHKVLTAGGNEQLDPLSVEEWEDEHPFTDMCGEPVPHRFEGRSMADEVLDQQRIKTVLFRQVLDNLYLTNTPEREVVEGNIVNPDQLSNKSPGQGIRVTEVNSIRDLAVPFTAQHSMGMLDYCDGVIERRTGINRSTMALDPEALQNQTATAVNTAKDAAHSKIELVARNFAEGGLKRLFKCLLKLVVANQDAPRIIRLRNEFVEMDPRGWNAEMDVSINTGLGTGSRDRDMAMLNMILSQQTAMMDRAFNIGARQIGVQMVPLVRNTLAQMVNAAGFKNPEMYFPEIDESTLTELVGSGGDNAETQKAQQEFQLETAKLQADIQMQREKLQMEAQLQRERMAMEREFKDREMQLEAELAAMKAQQETLTPSDINIRGAV